jgi:hypothetical protein
MWGKIRAPTPPPLEFWKKYHWKNEETYKISATPVENSTASLIIC